MKKNIATLKNIDNSFAKHWVLVNVLIGTFMSTLDGSVVNVALPTIGRELRTSVTHLQWIVTVYLVTIASMLLVFGRLSDIVGRKKVYSTGFVIFTVSSALCGMAQSIWQLVSFRVIQGLGAAMLMSNALALITQVFPGEKRGRALGISAMVVSLGSMTGPAVGGLLVGILGWRSIFWINVPIGLVGSLLAFSILPSGNSGKQEKLDWVGALTFAIGINSLLFLSIYLPQEGWDAKTLTLLLAAPLSYAIFCLWEKKVKFPLVDMELVRNRSFAVGNIARLLVFLAVCPVMFLMPFYLQLVKGLPPQQVGLVMMFFPIAMAIFSPVSGRLSDYFSPKLLTIIGPLVLIVGLVLLVRLNMASSLLLVCISLTLIGTGMGIFQAPNNSLIMGNVPANRLSITNALISVMRNIGTILGVALSVFVFNLYGARGGIFLAQGKASNLVPETIVSVINSTLSISLLIIVFTVILMCWGYSYLSYY